MTATGQKTVENFFFMSKAGRILRGKKPPGCQQKRRKRIQLWAEILVCLLEHLRVRNYRAPPGMAICITEG